MIRHGIGEVRRSEEAEMGRARLFRSDEPHMAGFGSGVVQETRYGTAAVVKIGIGWPGSVVSSIHAHP
jgi:hypothetical protein